MASREKAQVEFIYILAIVAIIVAIVSLSYFRQSSLEDGHISDGKLPANIEEEMKIVEDSLINFMRESAYETLKTIETRGGYTNPGDFEAAGFTFMNDNIPYWVKCETTYIPTKDEVRERIERETAEYIKTHKDEVENVFGKDVSFDLDKLRVKVNILDTRIDFKVYLPTTLRGYHIEQPYEFSLTTEFGRIYDFATDFSTSYSQERYFEYFTLASIYTSSIIGEVDSEDAHPSLPTLEILFSNQCPDVDKKIDRSKDELNTYLEKSIKHALTNVLWWVVMPDQSGSEHTKTFSIENVNGKKYIDLNEPGPKDNIAFTLPDNFSVDFNDEIHTTLLDPFVFIEKACCDETLNFDACIRTYSFNYDFTFPVNVRVEDKFLKHYFNFGVMSSIKDMLPGGCE